MIEANVSADGLPDAYQRTSQRGLTGAAWADDAEALACFDLKRSVVDHQPLRAWRGDTNAFDREQRFWRWQRHYFLLLGKEREELVQSFGAFTRRHKALPVGNRQVNGRQRASAQYRACDNDPGGGLLMNNEKGADR